MLAENGWLTQEMYFSNCQVTQDAFIDQFKRILTCFKSYAPT